jgi:hypothetical protein
MKGIGTWLGLKTRISVEKLDGKPPVGVKGKVVPVLN